MGRTNCFQYNELDSYMYEKVFRTKAVGPPSDANGGIYGLVMPFRFPNITEAVREVHGLIFTFVPISPWGRSSSNTL